MRQFLEPFAIFPTKMRGAERSFAGASCRLAAGYHLSLPTRCRPWLSIGKPWDTGCLVAFFWS